MSRLPTRSRTAAATGAATRGLGSTLVLALGTFAVGTDATAMAGFLPSVASTLRVSQAAAGQVTAVFAISYAVFAPVLATVTARIPRRALLVGSLLLLTLADTAAALAPSYAALMAARVVAAAGAATFTPAAGAVAAELVPPAQRGRAFAVVIGGLTVATALGVPLGNLADRLMDWRAAVGLVALLAALCAAGVFAVMPALPGQPRVPLRRRLQALRHPGVVAVLPLTVLALTAGYGLYAYAIPVMHTLGADADAEMWLLALYGTGAVLGNLISGTAVDRYGPIRVLAAAFTGIAVAMAAAAFVAGVGVRWLPLTGLLMVAWGAGGWSMTSAQQVRLMSAVPQEASVAIGLNSSALYLGIALGTGLGGLLLHASVPVALAACSALAVLGLGYLALTRHHR
ncbi:MFS transporter [Thermopolyspora sp. NPDC052614]|uniref:MFS transporter n=1 Tax=Thermopolyspora sp. NPDC052614 TaxID=3155682 RepID=UPI00342AEC3F